MTISFTWNQGFLLIGYIYEHKVFETGGSYLLSYPPTKDNPSAKHQYISFLALSFACDFQDHKVNKTIPNASNKTLKATQLTCAPITRLQLSIFL